MTVIHKLYQYLFLALGLFLTWQINAQSYISIPVTGFNHDLIAEGSGGLNRADSTTTTTFDNVNAGGDNVMYSKDFRGNNNPNTAPPFGLPVNRIINSVNLVGANYLLAPYDGKNALVLKTNGSTGTLVLGTPGVFSKIAFLGSSAEGVSGFNVVLNFSDGTNSSSTFSVPDWYFGSNFAIKGIGRVTRTQIGTQAPDLFTGDSENPRLYDNQITLAPPFNTKILTSISFNKTSSTGNTAILAINGITPVNAPSAPIATAATNVNATSFVANWNAATGATAYYLDVSTNSNFTAILPAYNNRNVNNVVNFSVSGITNNQNYFYRVRAANASGVSPSSNTINVIYVQCPPGAVIVNTQAQIDNFKLVYPTCTIINGNLNITDGPDISNVNGFSNILEIKSQLNIVNNAILNDLTGLSKLTKVNSNFWIAANKSLRQVKDFTNLTSSGFLYIGSNPQLVEISGFPKIAVMPGLVFENNDSLAIVNLNSKVIQTVENVTIKNNPKLQKIESIGIVMWINSILTLDNNSSLTDLSALNNIDLIKELVIQNNANLQNLNNLTKLTRMNGSIQLRNNSKLSDISGLQNIIPELIKGSGLIILNNPVLNLCNLPNFCTYLQGSGARSISGNAGNCLNEQAVLNICNALSAPVATAASNITETSFTANWQAVSGATSYFLDASTDPSFSTLPIDNFDAGNQLSTTITGAAPNTTYYYRIRAGNSNGQSPNSNVISVTTTNVAPIAPVALAATNVIASGFTANWQANSNTTGYFIDVSTNSNFSSFVTGYNNLSVGNVQNANITGLQLNTTYYFRIRAGNAVGTSPNSNVISVTTSNLAPAAPTALAATNISAIGFTANWQSNSNTTGYFIDVSTNSNFSNFV
ncbi:MAG: fibronectin type III domain-containing protein, partial [Saprospiraceae bacterium]|nr:fibronectin type III domain-containing protein [Saprospiraceae bacterium]